MEITTFSDHADELVLGDKSASRVLLELFGQVDSDTDDFACAVGMVTREPFDSIGVGKATVRNIAVDCLSVSKDEIKQLESEHGGLPEAIGVASERGKKQRLTPRDSYTLGELYSDIQFVDDNSGSDMKRRIQEMLSTYERPKWIAHALLGKKGVSFGIGEKSVVKTLCQHKGVDDHRRALALNPDVIELCRTIMGDGIVRMSPEVGEPFLPMLAKSKDEPEDPDGDWLIQPKYDGTRILVHIDNGELVGAWSRNAKEKTKSLPELEDVADALPDEGEYILDGEAIPYEDGEQKSFRHVMTRFGREQDIEDQNIEIEFKFFDLVYGHHPEHEYLWDGDMSSKETHTRLYALTWILPEHPEYRVQTGQPDTADELEEIYETFVNEGYEGAVIKHRDAEYQFNKRSTDWRKMIPETENIDLRIVGVEEGEDGMGGRVGSIELETSDGHVLGSVTEDMADYSGTDWEDRDTLMDEIVEVSWRELQVNDDGTCSLRFPSLEAYRDDKDEADSLDRVKSL